MTNMDGKARNIYQQPQVIKCKWATFMVLCTSVSKFGDRWYNDIALKGWREKCCYSSAKSAATVLSV